MCMCSSVISQIYLLVGIKWNTGFIQAYVVGLNTSWMMEPGGQLANGDIFHHVLMAMNVVLTGK